MRFVYVVLVFSCTASLSCQASTPTPRRRGVARIEDEDAKWADERARAEVRRAERERAWAQERSADAERERSAWAHRDAQLAELAAEEQAKKDQEERARLALRESCAADREARMARRKRDEEESREREAKNQRERATLEAYRKKRCTLHTRSVSVQGDGVEWDPDGYLRRTRGLGTEEYLECPADGPPGARGRVSLGVASGGSPGDPARIARISTSTRVFPRERDNICREADEEADAAAKAPSP